jgi:DNA methyltransferase 1-associated protein 1
MLGNANFDGFQSGGIQQSNPSSARARDSTAGLSDAGAGNTSNHARRPTRDSIPSATPTAANSSSLPVDLSKPDMVRFGVTLADNNTKFPSGVTFASDKLTKPRIAKSTIQTEKIAAILNHIGVPELIPLPTPR